MLRAAQKFGAQCVGVTLSQNQFDLATERVKAAGLSDKIEIRPQDIVTSKDNSTASRCVGMFEHIGGKNLPRYFRKIHGRLVEDRIVMNHCITTTARDNSPSVVGGQNFIDRYKFPGGELPHLDHAVQAMQEGGLETLEIECLRPHYVRTLNHWAESFKARSDEVRTMSTTTDSVYGASTWPASSTLFRSVTYQYIKWSVTRQEKSRPPSLGYRAGTCIAITCKFTGRPLHPPGQDIRNDIDAGALRPRDTLAAT